jgi:hypothetical protein
MRDISQSACSNLGCLAQVLKRHNLSGKPLGQTLRCAHTLTKLDKSMKGVMAHPRGENRGTNRRWHIE